MINLRFFTLALGVAAIHLYSALIILLGTTVVIHTTPLALLTFIPPNWAAVLMIASSIAAFGAFAFPNLNSRQVIWLILPQQLLLMLTMISVGLAIYTGHYPDGYVPAGEGLFISVDQIWCLTFVFWHIIEYGAVFASKKVSRDGIKGL